jgi:hypothetical protein
MMSKNITIELKVPTRMSDIKLEQYQKYITVLKGIDQETDESINFVNLKALEIFCGLQLKDSYKLPMSDFAGIIQDLSSALSEDTPLVKRFWFRGSNGEEVEFGMIPDLSSMSFGEYVDLDKYVSDWKQMHKAMAVLFRPINKKRKDLYDIEDYEGSDKYADHMKHMPLNVALGALVFFYRLGVKLSRHMMTYSLNSLAERERLQLEKAFSERNGVGINQFMLLLEEMSQDLIKLPKNHLKSASLG